MSEQRRFRILNRDGSINVKKKRNWFALADVYHNLIGMTWWKFALLFIASYFCINIFFAALFALVPLIEFEGMRTNGGMDHLLEYFFFSVQTFGTIGYGKISPVGFFANMVATLESVVGIFIVAGATGLIFARFSLPRAKILFSNNAVIRKFDDGKWLMFRIANERQNHITDAQVRVSMVFDDKASGSGIDTTLSQHIYSKFSYIPEEILENHDFVDVIERTKKGALFLKLQHIYSVKKLS